MAWTLLTGPGENRRVSVPFFFFFPPPPPASGQRVVLRQQTKKRNMSTEDFILYFKSHFKGKGWSKQRADGVDEMVFLFNYNLKNFQHIYENNALIDMEVRGLATPALRTSQTFCRCPFHSFRRLFRQSEKEHEVEFESASSEPSLFEDNIFAVIEDELPADYFLLEEEWWRPDGPSQDRRST